MNVSEKTLEKLVNWQELNVECIRRGRKAQNQMGERAATPVPTNDQSSNVGPSDGLPDEFTDNADPKGDACCYQGCRNV